MNMSYNVCLKKNVDESFYNFNLKKLVGRCTKKITLLDSCFLELQRITITNTCQFFEKIKSKNCLFKIFCVELNYQKEIKLFCQQ